jgi:hypothetical protein
MRWANEEKTAPPMSETDEDVCGCRGMGLRLYPYGGGPLAAG